MISIRGQFFGYQTYFTGVLGHQMFLATANRGQQYTITATVCC